MCGLICVASHGVSASDALTPEQHLAAGERAYQEGATEDAVAKWTEAARSAEAQVKPRVQISALEYLARGQIALGRYRQATQTLQTALNLAASADGSAETASLQVALGNAFVMLGDLDKAEPHLAQGLAIARDMKDEKRTALALNDLGNLHSARGKYADALSNYKESADLAQRHGDRILAARAFGNAADALRQQQLPQASLASLQSAVAELRQAGQSHEAVMTWLQVGISSNQLRSQFPGERERLMRLASEALSQAGSMADRIGDARAASYAWGNLGALYEHEQRYDDAASLSRKAISIAQRANAPESLYRWQWQLGRVLARVGDENEAIAAYRRAVQTLQTIRTEFADTSDPTLPSFRESAGQLYFELVDQLLRRTAALKDPAQIATYLAEARDTVELFKAAELRDYFRDDCVDAALAKLTQLDVVSKSAAVIYPIMLRGRTELLLSLPSGLKRIPVDVSEETLTQEIRQLRQALEKRTTREFLPPAQRLYQWLIAPVERELGSHAIDTLIFVPDGALRTIPMAALHDGQRYLVEKYALGVTPGLSLTDPRPLSRDGLRVLALGVTDPVQGFAPLPNVSSELEALRTLFGGTTLLNEAFRVSTLERELKARPVTILHIASHGYFGNDARQNYVLSFDGKLTMDRLDQVVGLLRFRDDPLELLTLSACDTAAGDDRAALGLAGVAIKAGARSALATLWSVNDDVSSRLVAEFYRQLKDPSVSRVVALQKAQLKVLADPRYDHPGFWSPFLLINNWL